VIARSGAAVVVVVLTFVLAACGPDSDGRSGEGDGAPDTAESSSSATSESPSEALTETPTESASTPEVAPATGPAIKVKGLRVNAPNGWLASISVAAGQSAYPRGVTGTLVGLHLFPNSELLTVEELAVEELGYIGAGRKRLDDLLIDGYQVYHLQASPEPGVKLERFGTIVNDGRVAILFRFGNRESRAERDEIIQSVLATVDFAS
jgi:hypothetical protein